MLPNVAGEAATKLQILLYSLVLAVSTFAPVYLGFAGTIYGVVAAVTGASLIVLAWRLFRTREDVPMRRAARRLFTYSLSYLFVVFLALLTDRFSAVVGWTA
jgi:heme o synthase